MKKPLITRITNKTESPLIMDVAPGFPRIYVGAHKTVEYPGDIFTVMSEPACKSILKLDPEKFIIEYLAYCGPDYSPIWLPLERLKPVSVDSASRAVKDTTPKVVKEIIEKAEEVFVEKPAEVSTEPAKELLVEEAPKEEAPAVEDFFTTTVEDTTEDTTEDTKKTAKKRKAK